MRRRRLPSRSGRPQPPQWMGALWQVRRGAPTWGMMCAVGITAEMCAGLRGLLMAVAAFCFGYVLQRLTVRALVWLVNPSDPGPGGSGTGRPVVLKSVPTLEGAPPGRYRDSDGDEWQRRADDTQRLHSEGSWGVWIRDEGLLNCGPFTYLGPLAEESGAREMSTEPDR